MKRLISLTSLMVAAALTIAGAAFAGVRNSPFNIDKNGVILRGYDATSYFDLEKPVLGSAKFRYVYMGATWWFTSTENRTKFIKDRQKYMPQFGGYSAMAMSEGKLADSDPLVYKIADGKLYLNHDMHEQKEWEKNMNERIAKADENWPAVRPKL